MIVVLKDVSGEKLAAIELEDACGATVADLLEAAHGATAPRGAFSLVFGEATLQSFRNDALLSDVGISDGTTLTFVVVRVQYVVTCGSSSTKIWDSRTGECKLTLCPNGFAPRGCNPFAVVMDDGTMVLTYFCDCICQLWDIGTGACKQRLSGHSDSVNSAVFSASGASVITASYDATAKVWDIATGECVLTLSGHDKWVLSVCISHDESVVLTASGDCTAKIWMRTSGECIMTLEHSAEVRSAVFSADAVLVLTSSCDKTAKIWHRATGECKLTLSGHSTSLTNAVFSAGESLVLTTGHDAAKIWDGVTGQCRLTLSFRCKPQGLPCLASAAFSPDDSSVLACCWDDVSIWDSTTGECKLRITECVLDGRFYSAMYSADGALIVTTTKSKSWETKIVSKLWDSVTGECVQTLVGHSDVVCSAKFFSA